MRKISDKSRARSNARASAWYKANREDVLKRNKDRINKDPRQNLLNSARRRARLRGLPFDLEIEDLFIQERCPILGIPLARNDNKVHSASPTLDRIDNDKGYVKGNVQVISYKANTMKSNASLDDLLRFANWATSSFGLHSDRFNAQRRAGAID